MSRAIFLVIIMLAAPLALLGSNDPNEIGQPILEESQTDFNSARTATNPLGWEWVTKDTNAGYVWSRAVEVDQYGNSYLTGVFSGGSLSLDNHHVINRGGTDVFVARIDDQNNINWLVNFGGSLNEHVEAMTLDTNGNLYLVGSFDSPTFNVSTSTLNNSGARDAFTVRMDMTTGAFDWGVALGGSGFDNITGVTVDSNGAIVYSGWTTSPTLTVNASTLNNSGGSDFFVLWGHDTGVWDLGRIYGGTGKEEAHDIVADGNGRVIVVGEFTSSTLTLDQTSISHGGGTGSDSLVMRVDRPGVEWVRKPICSSNDRAWGVDVDTAGNVFVVGELFSNTSSYHSMTWGSIQLNNGRDYQTVYIVKFSNVGAIGWALETRSTSNYRNMDNPSIDVLGSRLLIGLRTNYQFQFYAGSGYSSTVYTDNNNVYNAVVVELTNTGAKTGGSGANMRTAYGNIDDVAWVDTSSGYDHVIAPFNSEARRSGSHTMSTDAPASTVQRYSWSSGPNNRQWYRQVGHTGTDKVLDIEPIGNNSTVTMVYSDTNSMNHRYGNHSLGGKSAQRLILAVSDTNGTWTHLDHLAFNSLTTDDGISGMAVSPNGTVWVVFYSNGWIDAPGLVSLSSSNGFYVASWTVSGGWLSLDKIGFSSSYYVRYDIAADVNGDVWVVGACSGTIYMHGSSYSGSGNWQICVAKRDATNGWNSIYRSNYYDDPRLDAITDHPNGGIVMWVKSGNYNKPSGSTQSVNYYPGALVRLFSSNGTMWWMGQPTCSSGDCNFVQGLDVKPNGDVLIAGYFSNSMSFPNCCSVNSGGGYDGYVAQFNNSGSFDWSIALGGTSNDYAYGLRYVGNGSIAVVGAKSGVISVGLTTLSSAGTGYVAMASDAGTWEWAAQPTGSTTVQRVVATGNGTIQVAGVLSFSNSPRTFGLDSLDSSEGDDIFLSRMSADGDADGITDNRDNCATIYNPTQTDYDEDASGDICDSDDDGEGISDSVDSCPLGELGWTSNNSTDHDTDGCKDDLEDDDDDNDGLNDLWDACSTGALNWNSNGTSDYDSDGCKDSNEDLDDDNDSVNDTADGCPKGSLGWLSSPQTDHDGDGCKDSGEDGDDDGDGIGDEYDSCDRGELNWTSTNITDNDGDGCLDVTEDLNDDDDDFFDYEDYCPNGTVGWYSGAITDYDGDGCKDSDEDLDDDSDGVPDIDDNCQKGIQGWITNPTVDFDADGCHDWNEDIDDDGDGVSDLTDKCSRTPAGATPGSEGCAFGEIPDGTGGGGGSVNMSEDNQYENNTYVNNTYVNNTYLNNTFDNETFQNQSFLNNTYSNETFQNQSYQNNSHLNQTFNEGDIVNGTDSEDSLTQSDAEATGGMTWEPFAVLALMVLLLFINALHLVKKPAVPTELPDGMTRHDSEFDEIDHTTEVLIAESESSPDAQSAEEPAEDISDVSEQESTEASEEPPTPPPLVIEDPIISDGFEWLEWPEGSGQNHFRPEGTNDEWQRWPIE